MKAIQTQQVASKANARVVKSFTRAVPNKRNVVPNAVKEVFMPALSSTMTGQPIDVVVHSFKTIGSIWCAESLILSQRSHYRGQGRVLAEERW